MDRMLIENRMYDDPPYMHLLDKIDKIKRDQKVSLTFSVEDTGRCVEVKVDDLTHHRNSCVSIPYSAYDFLIVNAFTQCFKELGIYRGENDKNGIEEEKYD